MLVWRLTPLAEAVSPDTLLAWRDALGAWPYAPAAAIALMAAAMLLMAPLIPLTLAMALVFGPVHGSLYSSIAALISAAIGCQVGRALGRDGLRRLMDRHPQVRRAVRAIRQHSLKAVIVARVVPILVYGVVNIVCGATGLAWRPYLLGTILGIVPLILVVSTIGAGLEQAARTSLGAPTLAIAAVGLAGLVAVGWSIRDVSRRRAPVNDADKPEPHGNP
ncbi:VTT domain-containing protein [uncultured Rhodospira sp.]|uniref:TVP38/TMEM64 family protein n=1 Tax=uncultured Rhodospira sp. TaxID=1936189 RepID=UPI00261139F2|nr:VTT domain-containing protein [uncultured Rhodospira sp.]